MLRNVSFARQILPFAALVGVAIAHAKVSTRYYFSPSVYVTGGWDDFLNRSRKTDSIFLGAGLRWSDDDIKYLLSSLPKP